LTGSGKVLCWGYGHFGNLGNGTTNNSSGAVQVSGLSGANDVAIGYYHTGLDHYFMTANHDEINGLDANPALGWLRTGNSFKAGGSTAVCRFYGSTSPGPNSHFYTVNADECAYLNSTLSD
jgi:hypothetical protein